MKTQRTINHLAKGAAALLALLIGFGSFAATASALQPGPDDGPAVPGIDELGVPGICELIECLPPDDGGEEEPGDEDPGDEDKDEPGDEDEDEPGDEDEPEEEEEPEDEVEVEDETEENIDTPVEATPTFTG